MFENSVDSLNFVVVGFGYAVMALYAPSKMAIKIVSCSNKISSILFHLCWSTEAYLSFRSQVGKFLVSQPSVWITVNVVQM